MRDFAEMVQQFARNPASHQRSNPDGQERESHIRPLLPRRREPRDVFIIARRVNDLAQSNNGKRYDRRPHAWIYADDQPSHRTDQGPQRNRAERRAE